jgi:hypothetical protein
MGNDPLDIAILGIEEELECFVSDEGAEYDRGYKDALNDTIENLRNLQRTLNP